MKGLVTYGCDGELFLFDAAWQGKKLVGPTSDISQCIAFKQCLAVQSGSSLKVHFFAPSDELMVLNSDACLQRLFVQLLPNPSALRCPSSNELIVITGMVERALTLANVTLCHKGFITARPYTKAVFSKYSNSPAKRALDTTIGSLQASGSVYSLVGGLPMAPLRALSVYSKSQP